NMAAFTEASIRNILGGQYLLVDESLLPTLGTGQTKSLSYANNNGEGATVTVDNAIFYVDRSSWAGRQSGTLFYDISTEAAYFDGSAMQSAFQNDEVVIRGYMYQGGTIMNNNKVAGLKTVAVS